MSIAMGPKVRLVSMGYLVVLLFLAVFVMVLAKGASVQKSLEEPSWALLIAFIVVSPLLLPTFIEHVIPRLTSIKISELVELSFSKAEVATYSLASLTDQLKSMPDVSAPEYPTMMTSYSNVIIETIKDVQKTKDEILVVDLREGKAWIPPNLYFLALLASHRTVVRQIAFVETRHIEGVFIGLCFPEEILQGLGEKFPGLQGAANASDHDIQPLGQTGVSFFNALGATYATTGGNLQALKDSWLNGRSLFQLLGSRIHRQQVEWKEPFAERDYKYILQSPHPYVAATQDGQLESVISRDRLGFFVARQLAERSTVQ